MYTARQWLPVFKHVQAHRVKESKIAKINKPTAIKTDRTVIELEYGDGLKEQVLLQIGNNGEGCSTHPHRFVTLRNVVIEPNEKGKLD